MQQRILMDEENEVDVTKSFLMGNQAFAHAALEAGARVCAGYPGTPSSEVIETIAQLRDAGAAHDVYVEWSTNEKAALEMLAGASLSGARTLFTAKQVGLNVASDALMSLNYIGVEGGTVLLVADDPGPISSQTEQDTRRFASFAKVPVFDPATPEQGCAMVAAAYDLSEKYHTPVIFRPTTRICHASTFIEVEEETQGKKAAGFKKDASKWVIFPGRSYRAHGEINERLLHIAQEFSMSAFNPWEEIAGTDEGAKIGIIAGGISYSYAQESLRQIEEKVTSAGALSPSYRLMQIGTPYPFPEDAVAHFANGLDKILVLEELDHVIEDELLKLCGKLHARFDVHGKLSGDTTDRGENDVDSIAAQIEAFFGLSLPDPETIEVDLQEAIPERPAVLCAGCPHRGAFYAVKKALGRTREAVMCGDIGCYTLGNAEPLNAVDTCLDMGAGITMAQGFNVIEPDKKAIAFVGDSTFFASGMTGVANAVYNRHDITIVVLDNATTAMTGSQPHPGTGATLMGGFTAPISIYEVLTALGVKKITKANPLFADKAIEAAREALDYEGPSAVIYESPCTKLTKPKPPVYFIANACAGCRKCVTTIGCPALGWSEVGHSIVINRTLCVGCGLCTDICEYGAITCPTRKRVRPVLPPRSQRLHAEDGSLSRFPTPQELAAKEGGSDD